MDSSEAVLLVPARGTPEQVREKVETLKARFAGLVADDQGVIWHYVPACESTKDDPLGRQGFLAWKKIIGGKQYGAVQEFTHAAEVEPDFFETALREARAAIDRTIQFLNRH